MESGGLALSASLTSGRGRVSVGGEVFVEKWNPGWDEKGPAHRGAGG